MKKIILFLALSLIAAPCSFAQFKNASYGIGGYTLPYKILFPEGYDESKQYPLLIFLHGAGERGNDNENQLIHGKQFLLDNFYSSYPAVVVVPQCPSSDFWSNTERHQIEAKITFNFDAYDKPTQAMETLMGLISWWISSELVDPNRVYIGGLSMGGMGAFELLWRMPDTFAAAFPICGGSSFSKMDSYAKNTAVWIFHGSEDKIVSPSLSRDAYNKLKRLECDVRYTEYEGVGHGSWNNTFQEEGFAQWLFSKHR